MNKSKYRYYRNRDGWLYAIFAIFVIFLIGYIFFSSEQKAIDDKLRKSPLPSSKEKLIDKRNSILHHIEELNSRLASLSKKRKIRLFISRTFILSGIISINLYYYHQIVPLDQKQGHMINHFSDCTAFLILLYSAIAFIRCGTVKAFSDIINNALFKVVFRTEHNYRNEKEALESELKEIEIKLQTSLQ